MERIYLAIVTCIYRLISLDAVNFDSVQILGHCLATWYAMSRFFVTLTEIGTSWRVLECRLIAE